MGIPGPSDGHRDFEDDLERSRAGDAEAFGRLFNEMYDALHRRAQSLMRRERPDHTLQPTALVGEVYAQLAGSSNLRWENRLHFFKICSRAMRRVLIDHAKSRKSLKRGGGRKKVPLDAVDVGLDGCPEVDHVAMNDALLALEIIRPDHAHALELHYYGGLTGDLIAEVMGRSPRTIDNLLKLGRNWLHGQLK